MARDDQPEWHDVGSVEELATRTLQEVRAGRKPIALTHRNGQFTAISGACNHVGGPLGQGRLVGDYVTCPWHDWQFHCPVVPDKMARGGRKAHRLDLDGAS